MRITCLEHRDIQTRREHQDQGGERLPSKWAGHLGPHWRPASRGGLRVIRSHLTYESYQYPVGYVTKRAYTS